MSIINDALKKTHQTLNKSTPPPPPPPPTGQKQDPSMANIYEKMHKAKTAERDALAAKGTADAKKDAQSRTLQKLLKNIFTLIVLGAIGYGAYYYLHNYPPVRNYIQSLRKDIPTSRQHIAQFASKKKTYKEGDLVLNGTSLVDGKRVALINDEIYEVGDMVDGKTITTIELNEVQLQDSEKIVTLKIH